jgi:hypothetical protein
VLLVPEAGGAACVTKFGLFFAEEVFSLRLVFAVGCDSMKEYEICVDQLTLTHVVRDE